MTSKVPDVSRAQGKSLSEAEDEKRTGRERKMGDGVWPRTNVSPPLFFLDRSSSECIKLCVFEVSKRSQ